MTRGLDCQYEGSIYRKIQSLLVLEIHRCFYLNVGGIDRRLIYLMIESSLNNND